MPWWILIAGGLALVNLACLGLVLVGLPGTWLLLGISALVDYVTTEDLLDASTLWIGLGLAALGEVVEFMAGSRGARRAGAGRRGSLGALLGGIAGGLLGTVLIPVPVVGSLLGAALGAFGLAAALERNGGRDLAAALRAGRGAATGQITGTVGKLGIGVVVWLLVTIASFR